jgi:phytoene dehydrogenase-like protein
MSGLAAGIRLAYYDQRVCILERHTTIGGLNSFYRLDGRNYDVGLHAVTNYVPKGTRRGPLARLLKQLRFQWEELALSPQVGSLIAFPGVSLRFTNHIELLAEEVARKFPAEKDNFQRLLEQIADYDDAVDADLFDQSARQRLGEILGDPLLAEMLLCPLMFYGNAREHDMDWGQFCILFRSVYLEGLARPLAGVRLILKKLVRRFRELGGELRLRSGVNRIVVQDQQAAAVVLDDGTQLAARNFLSSAGLVETLRLCEDASRVEPPPAGQLSFIESVSILDRQPRQFGYDQTMVFFNDSPEFHWQKPDDLADVRSGVVCSPNNFLYDSAADALPEGVLRITALASYDRWNALSDPEYRLEKLRWYDALAASATRFIPEFRHAVVATDMFTPTTIRRFTGHSNGAVYGAPDKRLDGTTHLGNLYLCGTDQGFVGIIGAIISGISIANRHLLKVS